MVEAKILKAVIFSTWLYSLLFWFYVAARITINNIDPGDRFIKGIPYITFAVVGVLFFLLSFSCLIIYLTNWGFGENKFDPK